MKTRSILLSFMLLVGLIGFNSCEKDSADPLTQEEAQQQLAGVSTEYNSLSTDFQSSTGVQAYGALYSMDVPFDLFDIEGGGDMGKAISNLKNQPMDLKQLTAKGTKHANIDFESYAGTWTWTESGWDYSSTPSDKIVINFPYNSTTNNATLTYYDYATATVDMYGYSLEYMSGLKGEMKYNNTVVLSFAYSYSYSELSMDYSMNLTVGDFNMVDDYSYIVDSNYTKATINGSTTFKKSGTVKYKESFDEIYSYTENQGADVSIDAKVVVGNIEFRASYDFNTYDLYNTTTFDPNDYVKMSIYTTSGAKVGEFKYEYESSYGWVLYFYYNDGTKVLASSILDELADDLDSLIMDLFYDYKK